MRELLIVTPLLQAEHNAELDMIILSTAMPRIVSELNGLELYAWVTTFYMLASTVLVPIYGKFGDLYGCKLILVIGISIFLIGTMPLLPHLISGREFGVRFRVPSTAWMLASSPQGWVYGVSRKRIPNSCLSLD